MDVSPTAGGVMLALIGVISAVIVLFGKMWFTYTEHTKKMFELVEKNALSNQALTSSIDINTQATKEATTAAVETAKVAKETATAVKAHGDALTSLIIKTLRQNNKRRKND